MESKTWENLSDEELLKLRFKDLGLKLDDGLLLTRVQKVREELDHHGLKLQPRYYLGDEWFSPEGETAIAIPFFLAHSRLQKLERSLMLECEGEKEEEFFRLLRHEMGHVFDHAFKVSKRRKWQKIFGSNSKPYNPDNYRARAYSKSFVHNIANDYAQAHPDEDFAETFAVWLDPHSNWREKYRSWGAIKKLEYVDELAREFKGKSHSISKGRMPYDVSKLSARLLRHYSHRKKLLAVESVSFFDADLKMIFAFTTSGEAPHSAHEISKAKTPAAKFLKKHKKKMISSLSFWTRERKYVIDQLFSKLEARTQELRLSCDNTDETLLQELSSWLSALIMNHRLTGKWSRRLS